MASRKKKSRRTAAPNPGHDAAKAKHVRMLLVGTGVIVIAIFASAYWRKNAVGEPCEKPHDCRSGMCVGRTTIRVGPGGGEREERLCSAACASDADCPTTMRCAGDVSAVDPKTGAPVAGGDMSACAPR